MYKDKDKQREANAERQRRYRAERGKQAYPKGVTQSVTDSGRDKEGVTGITKGTAMGITSEGITEKVLPEDWEAVGKDFKTVGDDIRKAECSLVNMIEEKPKRGKDIENWDDLPISEQKALLVRGRAKDVPDTIAKRGKDIKTFADLPPDVQETIGMMSRRDGKIDPIIKANRTAIAINYQHLFPGRYHSTSAVSTGTVTGKPGDADYDGICTPEWRAERGR